MIKILAEKSIKLDWYYKIIFENIPSNSWCQLGVMVDVVNIAILNEAKNSTLTAKISDSLEVCIGNPQHGDDYYIAFYDPFLNHFYENRYGLTGIVYDEDKAMLKFSKSNFEHILKSWQLISKTEPKYLIITQDDSGWIDMQSKNDLNDDEIQLIQEYNIRQEAYKAAEEIRIQKRNQEIN